MAKKKQWKDILSSHLVSQCPSLGLFARWQFHLTQPHLTHIDQAIILLRQYPDWPWSRILKQKILNELDGQKQWTHSQMRFIQENASKETVFASVLCRYNRKQCQPLIKVWSQGVQDKVSYDYLLSQLKISRETIYQRARYLFWHKKYEEAATLIESYTGLKATALKKALHIFLTDHVLDQGVPKTYAQNHELRYAYARKSFVVEHPQRFFWLMKGLHAGTTPHTEQWSRLLYATALDLIERGKPTLAVSMLEKTPLPKNGLSDDFYNLAGLICFYELKNPTRALSIFRKNRMRVLRPMSIARAEYWSGVMLDALGQKKAAQEKFKQAAQYPHTYYGQRACRKIGCISSTVLTQNDRQIYTKSASDYLSMILLSGMFGYTDTVFDFLMYFSRFCSDHMCFQKVKHTFLKTSGHLTVQKLLVPHTGEIFVVDLQNIYPKLYVEDIKKYLSEHQDINLNPSVILALIHTESMFYPKALSSAGAGGLMQLMPKIAEEEGQDLIQKPAQSPDRFDPQINLQLGIRHFVALYKKLDGHLPLVFAAYNAGIDKCLEWQQRWGSAPDDHQEPYFIERLSYEETRSYVKKLIAAIHIYEILLKK